MSCLDSAVTWGDLAWAWIGLTLFGVLVRIGGAWFGPGRKP